MDKFEEYFRTTKQYENMLLEITRNQISASVFDKRGNKYRNHIVQTAYEVFQHQQAKVEELQKSLIDQGQRFNEQAQRVKDLEHKKGGLQKRVDAALQEIIGAARWVEEDAIDDSDFIKGGVLSALRRLEQALKGEADD